MAGEGALLRAARIKKGWSLHEAEDITKIRVRYLEAIEEENYAILPGFVYAKGFIRNYSKHLDLNPEEILAMYQESNKEMKQVIPSQQESVLPRKGPSWLKPLIVGILTIALAGTAIGLISENIPEQQPPASGYTPTPLPNAPQDKPPIEAPQTNTPQEPNKGAPLTEDLQVELIFDENCWISYKVDNGLIVEKTYLAGSKQLIQAKETILFITIGNAGGLNISINGKTIEKLGKSKEVVKNYRVTKDDIR